LASPTIIAMERRIVNKFCAYGQKGNSTYLLFVRLTGYQWQKFKMDG